MHRRGRHNIHGPDPDRNRQGRQNRPGRHRLGPHRLGPGRSSRHSCRNSRYGLQRSQDRCRRRRQRPRPPRHRRLKPRWKGRADAAVGATALSAKAATAAIATGRPTDENIPLRASISASSKTVEPIRPGNLTVQLMLGSPDGPQRGWRKRDRAAATEMPAVATSGLSGAFRRTEKTSAARGGRPEIKWQKRHYHVYGDGPQRKGGTDEP